MAAKHVYEKDGIKVKVWEKSFAIETPEGVSPVFFVGFHISKEIAKKLHAFTATVRNEGIKNGKEAIQSDLKKILDINS